MKKNYLWFFIFILFLGSCRQKYTPKPRGYFRIDFPEKNYHWIENKFPYRFEIPNYSQIQPDSRNPEEPNWINIEVPENKAEVHISYYTIKGQGTEKRMQLAEFMEESRELAYKHSIKANAINERVFVNPANDVYGIVYEIEGNAASPMQFFLTDSTRHFLRGALYIREVPNIDSIKPVIDFLEPDVVRLIETTHWE
ncbi:gliding motility lipoprotein GldD [Maribellus comscasis]|uniref:Gliding motility lipoprotein GldD n=1 Tax=Maribellus comscasis TaxID=2681766 RepID=A0A6I6JR16_9BACT|nr:gliding motility lipoprotein GldD [Maribellus comscasis]QGY42433.1 gliding motility lipoprotein GldD [Maribellus comscasis]